MMSSSTSASLISCAPSKNSVTSRYSRSGVSSTMPAGPAVGMPAVAHQTQRVVLVLDQPAHRLERRLVLEASVEDGPAELVPAVGAHVVHRVELPEQVRVGVARDVEAQRRRTARAGEPDRLHVEHGDAELVLDAFTDRVTPPAAHVEVRGLALRYATGNTSLGAKKRNALSGNATPTAMLTRMSKGWSTARYSRATTRTTIADGRDHLGDLTRPPGNDHRVDDPDGDDRHRLRPAPTGTRTPPPSDHVTPNGRGRESHA